MSYILDALRRADAERARGSVPDLHAQPLGLAPRAARAPRRPVVWIAAAALAVAAAVAAGWIAWQRAAAPSPGGLLVAPAAPPAIADTGPPASAQATAAAAPVAPLPTAAPALAPPVASPVTASAGLRAPARAALPAGPLPARTPARGASRPPTVEARVWQPADLPADVRRELPALRFGGAIHSPDPASRLLIVDGLLLHQGDEAAPGVRIREIRLRSVVLEFRDRLVEVGF